MMFAGGQVDQMLKEKREPSPSLLNSSIIDLIRTLARASKPGRIAVSKNEFALEMTKR
jgi:hypothetical protein